MAYIWMLAAICLETTNLTHLTIKIIDTYDIRELHL